MGTKHRNRIAVAAGTVGALAAILTATTTPAFGVAAGSSPPIVSASKVGPITLNGTNLKLVSIKLSAGKWLITGKMWADSVAAQSTGNTVVGCSIFAGSRFLDASAFNTPKVSGPGGTSAGANVVTAVISLRSQTTISFHCNDFGSHANAHNIMLTAIG